MEQEQERGITITSAAVTTNWKQLPAEDRDLLFGQRKWVDGVTDRILNQVDVLVDGPFIQAQRDLSLRFRGSSNQRLLDKATIQSMMK